MHRRVGVNQVVHIVVEEVLRIEKSAERHNHVKQVRTAEKEVAGMHSAHAAACDDGFVPVSAVYADSSAEKLFGYVSEPPFLQFDSVAWVAAFVAPCLLVDAVGRNDGQPSALYPWREHVNHAEVLEVVESSVLWRKSEAQFAALAAVYFELHISAEIVAVFLIISYFHEFSSF